MAEDKPDHDPVIRVIRKPSAERTDPAATRLKQFGGFFSSELLRVALTVALIVVVGVSIYVWATHVPDEAVGRRTMVTVGLLVIGTLFLIIWWTKEAIVALAAVFGLAGITNVAFFADPLPTGPPQPAELRQCSGGSAGVVNERVGRAGAAVRARSCCRRRGPLSVPARMRLDLQAVLHRRLRPGSRERRPEHGLVSP